MAMEQKTLPSETELHTKEMLLNVGPQHPAMHGIIRLVLELEGETVRSVDTEIGYLHRGFEKMSETVAYNGVFPYTDRMNYVSPLINNMAFAMTVEKLLGLKVPDRCEYIRVIMAEISRVSDHLTCIGASAMELGAFSVFLYMIKAREYLWELVEQATGARLTVSFCRVGGVKADLPDNFDEAVRSRIAEVRKVIAECDKLLSRNRIFVDRMKGTGVITQEQVISHAISGPFGRGSGVDYDVRRDCPYSVYDRLRFDVPLGTKGDNLDRYYCRMEEMEQSLRIVEQCLRDIPKGHVSVDPETGKPISVEKAQPPAMTGAQMVDTAKMGTINEIAGKKAIVDPTLEGTDKTVWKDISAGDKRVFLPPKEDTYGNIEGLMNNFKLVMMGHGIRPPKGEAYSAVEGANGELGYYVVCDGTEVAYRVHARPPCYLIMSALPILLNNYQMADVIPTFGSVNMIGGELDR
jgi:NADH-quinone oxidoreductase subunit D